MTIQQASGQDIIVHKAGKPRQGAAPDGDPITTEVVRHALNSAANQMKRALIRTAFSQIIYETLDFAVAIYDRNVQLLAQAPSLPVFMGTLSFCVTEAVKNVGGEAKLYPGDVLLYNWPFGSGSHPQDAVVIMPVYLEDDNLIGYTAVKAHWLDIGAKAPYSTDTVDVFQEGTIFPGVKLYKRGELNDDIYRMVLANSRLPKVVAGDLKGQVNGCRVGANGLLEVVRRFGLDEFRKSVAQMFDHGERIVRRYLQDIPDGRYVGKGEMDDNGVTSDRIPFEIAIEVKGSDIRIDFSKVPAQQGGPVNSPLPTTISACRVAISMLAGHGEPPNEGHFRAIEVVTKPGTLYHPLPPSPSFLFTWSSTQAIEVIYQALSKAVPNLVPASSGGCLDAIVAWGKRQATGESWADGWPHQVGQGAWDGGDGGTMMVVSMAATRLTPIEVWEAKVPFLIDKFALAQDSGGPGKYRGGPGIDLHFRILEETFTTNVFERSKNVPWGLAGGGTGRPNMARIRMPDGKAFDAAKTTAFRVPKDGVIEVATGGGGGYGPPAERPVEKVRKDLAEGYISEAFARKHYPHAFSK